MILTHKLITTENYLLIVDDSEIKENDYVYVEGHVNPQICKGFENNGDVLCYNNLPYIKEKTKKVISQLPLNNSPILEGVDLLPPLEDEVEKLADEIVGDSIYYEEDRVNLSDGMDLFMLGYNKAKEKYKYTLDDMKKACCCGVDIACAEGENDFTSFARLIQSLQQPKMPVAFNCITFDSGNDKVDGTHILEIRKTTNSQGLTQWVGKYTF